MYNIATSNGLKETVMNTRNKLIEIIIMVVIASVILAGCGTRKIEIQLPDGTTVTVETKEMSKEQVSALEQVADDYSNLLNLVQDGIFTADELADMGLHIGNSAPGANVGSGSGSHGGDNGGGDNDGGDNDGGSNSGGNGG